MTISTKKEKGVSRLKFSLFAPFPQISHGAFLREGGVSEGPFSSLNVGENVGDAPLRVKANLERIQEALNIPLIARGKQVHDTTIHEVTKGGNLLFDDCDGLITTEKGIGLLISHADCQAALFYDPKQAIIGAAHAGWKGNVKQIYTQMIHRFVAMGSAPRDLLVCISPSLGPDHAEFKQYAEHFPPSFWPFQVKECYFDLWAIAKRELIDAGVYEKHIEIASLCTYCRPKEFFSYRREGVTGRNGTLIALKS